MMPIVPSHKLPLLLAVTLAVTSTTTVSAGSSKSDRGKGKGKGSRDYYSACITAESQAPIYGVWFSPIWAGIHNGGFDFFNVGETAADSVRFLAESSDLGPIRSQFSNNTRNNVFQTSTGGGNISPGDERETCFSIDENDLTQDLYLSYAAAVLPSNDAFIGNNNPTQYKIYDASDEELEDVQFCVNEVLDAGTEGTSSVRV
jgi:hypothetical protein